MKLHHIEILRCPVSKEGLTLENPLFRGDEIISGHLKCGCHEYPIHNGIPRFVKDQGYSDNFGWQWNKWSRVQFEDQNVNGPMENHTRQMFKKITELTPEKIAGKTVLDIGCGPGRFSDTVLEMGGLPIAVDYSNAIDAAKANFGDKADNMLFLQADALNLPIKDDAVDFSFSIGVLHHTPSPLQGVQEAYRVTKKGGEFAISVYAAGGYYTFPSVQLWRRLFKLIWPVFKHYPPLIYAQTIGRLNFYLGKIYRPLSYPIRVLLPSVWLPDVRWAVLDTFDSITPSYQSGHTVYEVYTWFKEVGFLEIRPADWGNVIGRKKL